MRAIKSKICLQPSDWTAPAGSLFWLILLVIVLIAGPVSAMQAEFKQTTCWFTVPKDRDMRCGHLVVPENRTKANSAVIKLAVIIFEPDRERHEPVVYLSGGPGQAARIESKVTSKNGGASSIMAHGYAGAAWSYWTSGAPACRNRH